MELTDLIGEWLDGKLIVCGYQDQQFHCYELHNNKNKWIWSPSNYPLPYIKSTTKTSSIINSGLKLYVFKYGRKDIILFDRIGQISQNLTVFDSPLYDHCSFMTYDNQINILSSQDWYQCVEMENCNKFELWPSVFHPSCQKISNDLILILDSHEIRICKDFMCNTLVLRSMKYDFSQLTMLEGLPTILGGDTTSVELLYFNQDGSLSEIKTAIFSLKIARKNFEIIQVPESFFEH